MIRHRGSGLWPVTAATAFLLLGSRPAAAQSFERNFAGSVQLDYMAVPGQEIAREQAFDGATVELSLKLAMDFGDSVSSSVKICVACHGLETGMAFFDMRVSDRLNFRVGRFTPAFGNFPQRHDPANHRTSDKPLPYDMGRMLRIREWNMSVLPAPWVDNGVEINGTQFFGESAQLDYAVYSVGGPRAQVDALDFDYRQSRTPEFYYIDNNSRPAVGGRLAATLLSESSMLLLGASAMYGTYDPRNELDFLLVGAELLAQVGAVALRAEYLLRRTEMSLGSDPASRFRYGPGEDGEFDPYFLKEGWYAELEAPIGRFDLVARWDGMRRRGNVPQNSPLRSDSAVLRSTAAVSYRLLKTLRIKTSAEFYDFSDFDDDLVFHLGVAGPF
jgi:hypothetical protein